MIDFFGTLKERLGDVRVFVTDRNLTQIAALEIVWPEAKIIYCFKHIERNIRASLDDECLTAFQTMCWGSLKEEEAFLALLESKKRGPLSLKTIWFIDGLLNCKTRWLPSK